MNTVRSRRRLGRRKRDTAAARRCFRPLLEPLEGRDLLAFDLTISTAATAHVTKNVDTATGITLFAATSSGANVSVNDVNTELVLGRNVIVDSGSQGTETGNISTIGITTQVFSNSPGKFLLIRTGSGSGLTGDITLSGLQLSSPGFLLVEADGNVTLNNVFSATTISITAPDGTITMPNGGELDAAALTLTGRNGIGAAVKPLLISTDQLTTDSSGSGNQFLREANGLTALNLNAGGGNIFLTVTTGAVSDTDTADDITASFVSLILNDAAAPDVGDSNHPLNTNVDSLQVLSQAVGNLFLSEANGLAGLDLSTAAGAPVNNVILTLKAGALLTGDSLIAITAHTATITLSDDQVRDCGASGHPVRTKVDSLSIDTSKGGGSQFIQEEKGLTALDLNAGVAKGNVSLTVTAGAVSDTDGPADIRAQVASVTLSDGTATNFGTSNSPIVTNVRDLSVSTVTGGGSQFISQFGPLTALNLNAGSGDIILLENDNTTDAGTVADLDPQTDITAAAANVTLTSHVVGDFGSSPHPVGTSVNELSVDTSAGGGSQFIEEAAGLSGLALFAGGGDVTLAVDKLAVSDDDDEVDIAAVRANVTLKQNSIQTFGTPTSHIEASVDELTVDTSLGSGSQYIDEDNGLTKLNLNAGDGGDIHLNVLAGAVSDGDPDIDLTGDQGFVSLADSIKQDFGGSGAIGTSVDSLEVHTESGGGSQFISEADSTAVSVLNAGPTGSVHLAGGTFNLTSFNGFALTSNLIVDSPATLKLGNHDETIGSLAGNGTINLNNRQFFVGGNNADKSFAGHLNGGSVVKVGSGTLTLSGTCDCSCDVQSGVLQVNGTIQRNVNVSGAGATLKGLGAIDAPVDVKSGAHLLPSFKLRTGDLTMEAGSSFDAIVADTFANDFSQASVTEAGSGTTSIATDGAGVLLNFVKPVPPILQSGNQFAIIDSSLIDGTFAGLPDGAIIASNFLGTGLTATINYTVGGDAVITLSPGSLFPWHNSTNALDVTGPNHQPDGHVFPNDALAIISYINAFGSGPVPANAVSGQPLGFLDTAGGTNGTGDNFIAPADALAVINVINAHLGGEGEVASPGATANSLDHRPADATVLNDNELLVLLALDTAEAGTSRRRI
jgi:hypothetical protein